MVKGTRKAIRGGDRAADQALFRAVTQRNILDTVKALAGGANPNAIDTSKDGMTVMNAALQRTGVGTAGDQMTIVYALVNAGASLTTQSEWSGNPPLVDAVHTDEPKLVQMLLEMGAPVDAAGQEDGTALYWAADNMPLEDTTTPTALKIRGVINTLLKHGADPQRVYDALAEFPETVEVSRKKIEPVKAKLDILKEIPVLPGVGIEYQKAKERFEGKVGGRRRYLVGRRRKTRKVRRI